MLERLTPSAAPCRTIGNFGCFVSTISGRWAGHLRQEIPLHLQLADLLVQAGDQGVVVPGLLLLAVAEDTGGALYLSLLPGLNLPDMDLVPGGQLGHRLLALQHLKSHLALKAGLCFLRPCDISCSFPTATAALSLGAGLSLAYLSEIPGPPQVKLEPTLVGC